MRVTHFSVKKSKTNSIASAQFIFSQPFPSSYSNNRFSTKYWLYKFQRLRFRMGSYSSKPYEIWFKLPINTKLSDSYQDGFFIAALVLALALNEDLHFDGVVSQDLIKKIDKIEKYYRFEHPQRSISVITQSSVISQQNKGEAQFFSLGVDSFYTLLTYRDMFKNTPGDLLYIDGYDVPLNKKVFLKKIHQMISKVAAKAKSHPIFIQTNLRDVTDNIMNWGQYHVAALVAVARLLSYKHVLISGESFDWPDWGMRFGVDRLFSTSQTRFTLIGHNITRDIKIKKLSKHQLFPLFLDHVRVCWKNIHQQKIPYNCGACQKCLRTKLTFHALGIEKTPTLPAINLYHLQRTELVGHVRHEWSKLYEMLRRKPTDPKLMATIEEVMWKQIRL